MISTKIYSCHDHKDLKAAVMASVHWRRFNTDHHLHLICFLKCVWNSVGLVQDNYHHNVVEHWRQLRMAFFFPTSEHPSDSMKPV